MECIGFGVCRLATVSVMKSPEWTSPQLTQLLFGEHYLVISKAKQGWLEIFAPVTSISGWIRFEQHHDIVEEYYRQIEHSDFRITTDVASALLYRKQPLTVVVGSLVPLNSTELFKVEEQLAFNGEAKILNQKRDAEFLESIAVKFLNAPERSGGRTPFGIDSDAFIKLVYRLAGYTLTSSFTNMQKNTPAVEFESMKSGDLVYLSASKKTHHGICLSGGRVIHCQGFVRIEALQDNYMITESQKWMLTDVRRILV
jgi:hypothetical protein